MTLNNGFAPNSMMGFAVHHIPEKIETKRSIRERLFSWPWRPRQRTKLIPNPVCPPRGEYLRMGNKILCSPASAKDLLNLDIIT